MDRIDAGTYAAESMLPPERTLVEEFGVSRPTVRKALQQLQSADRIICKPSIGYKVRHPVARQPRRPNSTTVGVLLGHTESSFYRRRVVEVLEQEFSKQGISMLLGFSNFDVGQENTRIERFLEIGIGGLIITPALFGQSTPRLAALIAEGFPVVAMGEPRQWRIGHTAADLVSIVGENNALGVRLLAQHLYDLGHRHMGFVTATEFKGFSLRENAFRTFLQERNLPLREEWILSADELAGEPSAEFSRAIEAIIKNPGDHPTAFICFGDRLARQLMIAVTRLNLRVPKDLSVVSFALVGDDSQLTDPPLTVAAISAEEYASETVRVLVAQMQGSSAVHKILISPTLITRKTTAVPA
jgi:GntR family transcriptional regulator of arabinose operon